MPALNDKLLSFLTSNGASLVGFADLSEIDSKARDGFPYGISIAIALDPQIMSAVKEGPTKDYVEECLRVDKALDGLGKITTEFLTSKGYKAKPQDVSNITGTQYQHGLATKLPHKTVATRAGLGWIGKCALLVTKRFGSAVRLTTVLTDAPLETGRPLNASLCSHCTHCFDACPAGAITGESWQAGIPREALYDAFKCRETARLLLTKRTGGEIVGRTFCGLCIVACPWTKKYLERAVKTI